MTPLKYLDLIVPYEKDNMGQKDISLSIFKDLDASKQVIVALMAGKVLHYSRIKELCTKAKSDEQILSDLEKIGVIIQGCWIIRSERLTLSSKMNICRDYLLSQLYLKGTVNRKEFSEVTFLSGEESYELFSDLCVLDSSKNWKLKLDKDEKFIKRFPDMILKQKKEWDLRNQVALNNLKSIRKATGSSKSQSSFIHPAPTDLNGKLEEFFIRMFNQYGVCNLALLKEQFVKENVHFKKLISEDIYSSILLNVAKPFRDSTYVKKSVGNKSADKFRDIIIELFQEKLSWKKEDIKSKCLEKSGEEIPLNIYADITRELANQKGVNWEAKSGLLK